LKKGESILFEMAEGTKHLYQVTGIDVVDSRRGSLVLDTESPMLSLVTCYPFSAYETGGPMRYVVTATMIF
jgi:sortase A